MGTLSSISFSTLHFNLSVKYPEIRRFQSIKKTKNSCLLCGGSIMRNSRRLRWRCYSTSSNDDDGETSSNNSKDSVTVAEEPEDTHSNDPSSLSSRPPPISPLGSAYNNFQVDSFKLMELLGPEKVDPADVKFIKEKLFGYSTFWVTKEKPFGDLGEGVLFLGNLRGKREDVFSKFQTQLVEVTGNKYNLFMVEEPNSEDLDPRGGPCVSFGLLRKEVSEPGETTV